MPEIERVNLEFREGGSDKFYTVVTSEVNGGYMVTAYYGRRGSAPNAAPKTSAPVSLAKAQAVAAKLLREKTAKGYYPAGDQPGGGIRAARSGGPRGPALQRLLPADDATVETLLSNDNYIAQEKYDGERRVVRVTREGVAGFNLRGEAVALTEAVAQGLQALLPVDPRGFMLDGEDLGARFVGFDILEIASESVQTSPYEARLGWLRQLMGEGTAGAVHMAATAEGARAKRDLVEAVKAGGREGVVFKHRESLYIPGKLKGPNAQFKFKFVETATVIAGERKGDKSSISIFLRGPGGMESVGSVTIPVNHAVPEPGTLVDVRYLYAYRGGSLFQPVYLGPRTDIDIEEATLEQLKYKPDTQPESGPERPVVRR